MDRFSHIQWDIQDSDVETLEHKLYVQFKKHTDGFYRISDISYTYIDILIGLEDVDMTLVKRGDLIRIKICKI